MLRGRNILVGVTGSIAAYKAAILVRMLIREGAGVRVVMTPSAKEFITPLTLATLSKNPILVDFFDPEDGRWNSHVSLGEWADACLIAPATANTLAKMAMGVADNLLLTVCLSARCPVVAAPAMDIDMYAHAATRANLATLRARGVTLIEPAEGELASGLSGKGRMAEPEEIVAQLAAIFNPGKTGKKKSLQGKRLMVTAGPTQEAIDPVRYISNRSTGKMGYAIAEEFFARGAEVFLISGPTELSLSESIHRVNVVTAGEMYRESLKLFPTMDGAVMCAAVADYAPEDTRASKIKKESSGTENLTLRLVPTPDIAAELGKNKGARLLAGFALETENETENALRKLERKHFDFIVLNSLRDAGTGFGLDTNKISILKRDGMRTDFPLTSKREAASNIADAVEIFFRC